jgi:nucleotide-binding universal stress UspA family protein
MLLSGVKAMTSRAAVVPVLPAIELKQILYATDFSDASRAALPVVAAVARRYHSRVFVAHIWSPLPHSMVTPEDIPVLEERQRRDVTKEIQELLNTSELANLPAEIIAESGDPKDELERVVNDHHLDLAIISTHGRTGFKHLLMGSVAEELFRNLPCPVLTVGPRMTKRVNGGFEIKNILFPTDLSDESRTVFPFLASLAHEHGAKITFLHVLPPETESNPEAKSLAEPLRKQMVRIFGPEISPRCAADYIIESGDASEVIVAYAAKLDADLIGFGVRKMAEITTHFRNTVTYRVVMRAGCPVLTYRRSSW